MNGIILVISGPAGVGKTTLCDRLLKDYSPKLSRVITVTTRKPRKGEVNGVDYFFKTISDFKKLIRTNAFVEHAEIHGNLYGSLKSSTLQLLGNSHDVLLNIDIQGAASLKKLGAKSESLFNRIVTVFIMPLNLEDLRKRLKKRGQDSDQEIEKRLKTALNEINFMDQFDHVIHSKTMNEDYSELIKIYGMHSS